MQRLWPEYLEGSSPSHMAVSLMCLTKVMQSRALLSICRKGASGEVHVCWWCCRICLALQAPHTEVPVQPMIMGQSW